VVDSPGCEGFLGRTRRHQSRFVGDDNKLGTVTRAEFEHDVAYVRLCRSRADEQRRSDLGVGHALSNEPEHLSLTFRQVRERRGVSLGDRWAAGKLGY